MFAPELVRALKEYDKTVLRFYGDAYLYRTYAGYLCQSLQEEVTEDVLWRAMDNLEESSGEIISNLAPRSEARLVLYDDVERPFRSQAMTGVRAKLRQLAIGR